VNGLTAKQFAGLRRRITAWASAEPDWGHEEDYFIDPAAKSVETTMRFFQDHVDGDILEQIGVRIVEGAYPGSNYYAAKLTIDPAEATRRAIELGLSIRFVPENELPRSDRSR
jgi:hypothetical protein